MPSSIKEGHGDHPESIPDLSERSALIKHSDAVVVYGVASTSPPSTGDGDNHGPYEPSDEEALIGSPASDGPAGHEAQAAPVSTKTMLWIILPMVLGE